MAKTRKNDPGAEHRRRQVAMLMITMTRPSARRIVDALSKLTPAVKSTKSTVHRDMVAIKDEWKEARNADMDVYVGSELERLNMAEERAWIAYNKSTAGGTRVGDPRFLKILLDVSKERRSLLGLDAPKGIDLTSGGKPVTFTVDIGAEPWTKPTLDEKTQAGLAKLEAGSGAGA